MIKMAYIKRDVCPLVYTALFKMGYIVRWTRCERCRRVACECFPPAAITVKVA